MSLEDILCSQLAELNARSRWYSSQLWQVPFAYLGLTGIVLASIAEKCPSQLSLGFIASAIFGILVSIHICGVRNGERRAVCNLKDVEKKLQLPQTVEYKSWYVLPLQLGVIGVVILYCVLGIYLLF